VVQVLGRAWKRAAICFLKPSAFFSVFCAVPFFFSTPLGSTMVIFFVVAAAFFAGIVLFI
jgi:hypothetical protein